MHRFGEFLVRITILFSVSAGNINVTSTEYSSVYLEDTCACVSSHHHLHHLSCLPSAVEASRLGPAGFVFLSRDASFRREFSCVLTLRAPPKTLVFVQIAAVDLPMFAGTCKGAILQVYDGPTADIVKQQLVGVCGSALPAQTGFWSSGQELTISYRQGPETLEDNKSFNVSFTFFAIRKSGCREGEFRCTGGHYGCIVGELTCDGVDNCGDGSDESNAYDACGKYSPSSNPAVGGSVGVLVVLAVFGLIVGLGLYGANKRSSTGPSASPLQLPVATLTDQDAAAAACCAQPETNSTQRTMDVVLPQLTAANGVSLAVIDSSPTTATTTTTTFRIVEVTPNPQRRQLQITVVPCHDFLHASHGPCGGDGAGVRTSLPPPYDSLFPVTGDNVDGPAQHVQSP